jgi:hypothetical protein
MRRFPTAWFLLLLAPPALLRADEAPPVRLTASPRAAPSPSLKYRLLPTLSDQVPGNAAPLYRKAAQLLDKLTPAEEEREKEAARWAKWQQMPPGELPGAEVRRVLDKHKEVLDLLERAARCERCDWDLLERMRTRGILTEVPEASASHRLVALLIVRARLQLAKGQVDVAFRTYRTGWALARRLGESPALTAHLRGGSAASLLTPQLHTLIQHPKAPNLYWALTDLPRPFLDGRAAFEGERVMMYGSFPGLREAVRDPDAGPFTPAQVKACADMLLECRDFFVVPETPRALAWRLIRKHEAGKRALIAAGRPRERVEKMPHLQVALLHAFLGYDRWFDELARWQSVPAWQARPGLRRLDRAIRETRADWAVNPAKEPAIPVAPDAIQSLMKLFTARDRLERRLAALRCVEAIRLHAAANGGKLPASLADIKEVPIPADPLTGKPFVYRLKGGTALLSGPPPEGEEATPENKLSYELSLKR